MRVLEYIKSEFPNVEISSSQLSLARQATTILHITEMNNENFETNREDDIDFLLAVEALEKQNGIQQPSTTDCRVEMELNDDRCLEANTISSTNLQTQIGGGTKNKQVRKRKAYQRTGRAKISKVHPSTSTDSSSTCSSLKTTTSTSKLDEKQATKQLMDIFAADLEKRFCSLCYIRFKTSTALQNHYSTLHPELQMGLKIKNNEPHLGRLAFSFAQEAISGEYKQYSIDLSEFGVVDVNGLFYSCFDSASSIMLEELKKKRQFKVQFSVNVLYGRDDVLTGETETNSDYIQSILFAVEHETSISFAVKFACRAIEDSIENFVNNGSGWYVIAIESIEMVLCRWMAFSGGSSEQWTSENFPPLLKDKNRCYINTIGDSDSNHCFAYSIMCYFEWKKIKIDSERKLKEFENKHPDLEHYNSFELERYEDAKVKIIRQIEASKSNQRARKLKNGATMEKLIKTGINKQGRQELKYTCRYSKDSSTTVDFSELIWPFSLDQIRKFERKNPSIGLTIIGYDDEQDYEARLNAEELEDYEDLPHRDKQKEIRTHLLPLYICKEDKPEKIDLLLLMREDSNHFIFVDKLTALVEVRREANHQICRYCLQFFGETTYDSHVKHCATLGLQKTLFPKHKELKFKQYYRTQLMPFIYVADFEAILPQCNQDGVIGGEIDSNVEFNTHKVNKHVPSGYAWLCLNHKNEPVAFSKFRLDPQNPNHKGVDVCKRFLSEILKDAEIRQNIVKDYEEGAKKALEKLPPITPLDELGDCWFCKKPLKDFVDGVEQSIHRHHSHLPDYQSVGFSHQICNLSASLRTTFPCFIHNLTGYDSKMIIQALDEDNADKCDLIALNTEKFMGICLNKTVNFIDSMCFFNESLESIVQTMDQKNDFNVTRRVFRTEFQRKAESRHWGEERIELLLKKGAYPYTYMDSFERFQETELPSIDDFYNDLAETPMSDSVYQNAKKVWKDFSIKNLGEWHDLYVLTDVTLLADSIVRLREVMLQHFELDIAHYLSLPMFSFDAALKSTNVTLDLVQDPSMYLWLERSIRGGLTTVGDLRACKANNKYMSTYDKDEASSYLLYVDANNLYGSALSDYLPQGDFKWVDENIMLEIRKNPSEFVMNLSDTDNKGMYFEVDLQIEESLHDKFNAFPPCPYKRNVRKDEVSSEMQSLTEELDIGPSLWTSKKLITDLHPRKNYVCHYKTLKLWLELGVQITHVHAVLSFTQSKWMEPYITFNTKQRIKAALAKNNIEVKFWKNLNNTGYGKTIENKRGRQNIILITNRDKAIRYNKKPTIQNIKILNENLVLAICKRLQVTLDRPIAVGIACLELSKNTMYRFLYGYIDVKYRDANGQKRYWVCYSDTDSFVTLIETEDVYQDCKDNEKYFFDLSDYDPKHPIFGKFYSKDNAKRLAMFKDECANGVMTHFVATKPKMYSFKYEHNLKDPITGEYQSDPQTGKILVTNNDQKKAKGIGKSAVKNRIHFEDYVRASTSAYQSYVSFKRITSKNVQLYTVVQRKRAVNGVDSKRFFVDSVNSLAFGHKNIPMYI